MEEIKSISLDEILNEFGDDVEEKSDVLIDNMSNFCSALSFLTKNLNSMDEKKTIKLLKLIRKLLSKINQNTYDIVETLSNNDTNFIYKEFLNGYEDELLYTKTEFKPSS
jgi:hypothetical protein